MYVHLNKTRRSVRYQWITFLIQVHTHLLYYVDSTRFLIVTMCNILLIYLNKNKIINRYV